ncbi:MAG: hypothetical protein MJ058_07085 [Akkermansia sp.]|nr:hypothetical protein [Akkermansia sp.]
MQTSLTQFFLIAASAAVVLASCSGGDKTPSEAYKPKQVSPGHLVMNGRTNSEIIIEGVSYPRIDGGLSVPGQMVINLPDSLLPVGPVNASYVQTGDNVVDVQLPAAQEGEIAHSVSLLASFTETPAGHGMTPYLEPTGGNAVGYIQLTFDDTANGVHYKCIEAPINLKVISSEYTPTSELEYENYSMGDPSSSAGRWVQSYHITYMGVVETGRIRVVSTQAVEGHLSGYEGVIDLAGRTFTWTCDEQRVDANHDEHNNPGEPLAPY